MPCRGRPASRRGRAGTSAGPVCLLWRSRRSSPAALLTPGGHSSLESRADSETRNPIESNWRERSKRKPNSIAIAIARKASSSTSSRASREAAVAAESSMIRAMRLNSDQVARAQYKRSDPLPSLRSRRIALAMSTMLAASTASSIIESRASPRTVEALASAGHAASESSSWRGVTVQFGVPRRKWTACSAGQSERVGDPARRDAAAIGDRLPSLQALAIAMRCPARLPLSTEETSGLRAP